MRIPPPVKENQMPGVRPDDGTVPLYRADVRGRRVMPEDKLAARPLGMISAEEKTSQRI